MVPVETRHEADCLGGSADSFLFVLATLKRLARLARFDNMNPCHRCGFDKFETHDGLFFCTRCQTQSQVCCDCVNLGVMVVPGTVAIFPWILIVLTVPLK